MITSCFVSVRNTGAFTFIVSESALWLKGQQITSHICFPLGGTPSSSPSSSCRAAQPRAGAPGVDPTAAVGAASQLGVVPHFGSLRSATMGAATPQIRANAADQGSPPRPPRASHEAFQSAPLPETVASGCPGTAGGRGVTHASPCPAPFNSRGFVKNT